MNPKEQAYLDWKAGAKYKEIAEKYGVSLSAVKSWATRDWKLREVATSKKKSCNLPQEKVATKPKQKGAPKGNKNAKGNSGGGAPKGNQNAFKHGGYAAIFFDTLGDDERDMIDGMDYDGEKLLLDEIALLTVRERRIMQSINKYRDDKRGQALSNVTRFEEKREFKDQEEREEYERREQKKVKSEEKLPGHSYNLTTITESTYNIIHRLEEALTRCQAQKQRCIDALNRLRESRGDGGGNEVVDAWISGVMEADSQ